MATRQKMGIFQTGHLEKIFLRSFRWLIEFYELGGGGKIDVPSICYVASRPKVSLQDQVVNHQHETISYPVRATWEPIDIAFWHVGKDTFLWDWLMKCYHTENQTWGFYEEIVKDVKITMVDGIGNEHEKWSIQQAWLINVDLGELDYTSNEIANARGSLKYARATMESGKGADGGASSAG